MPQKSIQAMAILMRTMMIFPFDNFTVGGRPRRNGLGSPRRTPRRGSVLITGLLCLTILVSFAVLSIDLGALYQAKSNLKNAADAGSLAAAQMLRSPYANLTRIQHAAREFAEFNVPGVANIAAPAETTTGIWDFERRSFAPSGLGVANAVRVTVRRRHGQSQSVGVHLAQFFGISAVAVDDTAIAAFERLFDEDGNPIKSRIRIVQ